MSPETNVGFPASVQRKGLTLALDTDTAELVLISMEPMLLQQKSCWPKSLDKEGRPQLEKDWSFLKARVLRLGGNWRLGFWARRRRGGRE